jgi:AraC-like DNA-binding protein/response regulator of citrate/malate metabolism
MLIDELPARLAQLTTQPPDAIVLDMSMAPQSGWETVKMLKDDPALHSTPVLIFSLSGTSGSVLQLDYLTKPIGITELTQALNKQLLVTDANHTAKTILIADDDLETLEMHARIVETRLYPHRAVKAHNGREALKALERETVDLVLLDLLMPELDGFGVLEAMRENPATRDIPVIVLTGQVLTEKDMARLNRDVATVLNKGVFSVDETLAHVDAALERIHKLNVQAQRLVRQAMAFLHEHYGDPISREDIARHVGMNGDYLTFCFRIELGMTPMTYLNRYRLNRAKWLLKNGKQSITDVAFAVGFRDSGYFSRVFRREVGTSPEAYRRT